MKKGVFPEISILKALISLHPCFDTNTSCKQRSLKFGEIMKP